MERTQSNSRNNDRASKGHGHGGRKKSLGKRADRHALYELAVQAVDVDFDFIDKTFRKRRGRTATLLREDFCGTAKMCCEWVQRRKNNWAIGIDIDKQVLKWARKNNIAKLNGSAADRVTLIRKDVRKVRSARSDIVLAFNFSYQLLKDRNTLKQYFVAVRNALADDGIFFLDAYGGYDAYREIREKRKCKGFTYIWDQASYDPISGSMRCHIHFTFPDGSKLKRAFSYEWRLWTLPELRDLLDEAGFSKITVYWEGTNEETGEGDGIYRPVKAGDADPAWLCYLAAEK